MIGKRQWRAIYVMLFGIDRDFRGTQRSLATFNERLRFLLLSWLILWT